LIQTEIGIFGGCGGLRRNHPGVSRNAASTVAMRAGPGAPRLLNAGLSLAEIANHMVWSVRDAANVIEDHAGVSPDEIDGVLVKPAHEKRAEG
jgi:hypothetical protein